MGGSNAYIRGKKKNLKKKLIFNKIQIYWKILEKASLVMRNHEKVSLINNIIDANN